MGIKFTRTHTKMDCLLEANPAALKYYERDGTFVSEICYNTITKVQPVSDEGSSFVVFSVGRPRMFATPDRSEFLSTMAKHLQKLGLGGLMETEQISTGDYRTARLRYGNETTPKLAEFEVLKRTERYPTPINRKLVVTETSLVERDAATYAVVSSRPLASLFGLVRHWDEPQRLTVEYRDGASRVYVCSRRDDLCGVLLDGARNSGNVGVNVQLAASPIGDRLLPLAADTNPDVTTIYFKRLASEIKAALGHGMSPYNAQILQACREFNINTSPMGVDYSAKKSLIKETLEHVLRQLSVSSRVEDVPALVLVTLLQTIQRIQTSQYGYKSLMTVPESLASLVRCTKNADDGVVFHAVECLRLLAKNPRRPGREDIELEIMNKRWLLQDTTQASIAALLDSHSGSAGGAATGSQGTLVMMAVVGFLDSVLVSDTHTTKDEQGTNLLRSVAQRYSALLSLFRSPCAAITEGAALLMRTIVREADAAIATRMQDAALSEGVLLRHIHSSLFAPSADQRFVSRYLVELWATRHAPSKELFRHMLPTSLLLFLDVPPLTEAEKQNLEMVEMAELAGAGGGRGGAGGVSGSTPDDDFEAAAGKGLATRLRRRLVEADQASASKAAAKAAGPVRVKDEGVFSSLGKMLTGERGMGPSREDAAAAASLKRATQEAAATGMSASDMMASMSATSGDHKEDNFAVFFHMILNDHQLPDLIWNTQTRGELRAAIEGELREIEREIELGGTATGTARISNLRGSGGTASDLGIGTPASPGPSGAGGAGGPAAAEAASVAEGVEESKSGDKVDGDTSATRITADSIGIAPQHVPRVAWNYSEFEVEYPSLSQELKVGGLYLRVFLEAGLNSVKALRTPQKFFDALYRRALRERSASLKALCLRGMTRVYDHFHREIGEFEDTPYIVWMLADTSNNELRDRLIQLLAVLIKEKLNAELMIKQDSLELLVDLLTTAHMQEPAERGVTKLQAPTALMITDGSGMRAGDPSAPAPAGGGGGGAAAAPAPRAERDDGESGSDDEDYGDLGTFTKRGESIAIWFYRAVTKEDIGEGKPEKGPYSLQDMIRFGRAKKLRRDTLVWAQGMREWVRLDSMRCMLWAVLSDGVPILKPSKRGELVCSILHRLVTLRPSTDPSGAPVRPVPKAKRVLCGSRCLPHIAQSMLAGSPRLVDAAATLITELMRHNPRAMIKLYLTGVFFFILSYPGSNFLHLATLLEATHLQQSFHADASTLRSETSVAKRSILGAMLPESLICVLANSGAESFVKTFLSSVDNPEVIWKFEMRAHVVDMINQHLGDLQNRLAANPCTLYDYCPIPRVIYERLEDELWCHNFYLANLCSPTHAGWKIEEPVQLLRAVLDAWRAELSKEKEEGVSADEAYTILKVEPGTDAKGIRNAYRKLARIYHPDKNPQGRDMFEKIQKAYEMLSASKPEMATGPDPHRVLLMVKTQCILFKDYQEYLKPYKYAGYPFLLDVLVVPADGRVEGERAEMLEAASRLVYLTCLCSPLNANQLIVEDGVPIMSALLNRVLLVTDATTPEGDVKIQILDNILHTISGLSTLESARTQLLENDTFCWDLCIVLRLLQASNAVQYALETVSRLAIIKELQDKLVESGVIWSLFPLLFRFDETMEAGGVEQEAATNMQKAANLHAKLAVRAVGRLGGYLDNELTTPVNDDVRACMNALLTPVLAKRFGRPKPEPLLKMLNSHSESAAIMWNVGMRGEVLGWVAARRREMEDTGSKNQMEAASYRFTALAEELKLAGVYIRQYLANPASPLDDPYALCMALLKFINGEREEGAPPVDESVADLHLRQALRALHHLVINNPGVEDEIANRGREFIPGLFDIIERTDDAATQPLVVAEDAGGAAVAASSAMGGEGAGTGAGGGAGGARTMAASATASLRELALTVVAAIVPDGQVAGAIAGLHKVPVLIRLLPENPTAFGSVLRSLFVHSSIVAEIGRVGAIVDLMVLFAGGTASGPLPVTPAGKPQQVSLTVERSARREAGWLLSALCSDAVHGPPNLLSLGQLLPQALAQCIAEGVSGATMAGGGATGKGVGAAGAGGTGESEALIMFDGDHENPELLWDAACRHELRCALGELKTGLDGLRARARDRGAPGGFDGAAWSLPPTYRIRYSPHEGELRVGGVFVRLFLKEPTYPLRQPKAFVEACMDRLLSECEHLVGLTSEDIEVVQKTAELAEKAVRAEIASGGMGVKTAGGSRSEALVTRGEDVMTQVTHAIVCILRVRTALCDHIAQLGYVSKLVQMLGKSAGKKPRHGIGVQCMRVIEVLAQQASVVRALSTANAVHTILRTMQPLHRDVGFTLETLKALAQNDTSDTHAVVDECIRHDAIPFLLSIVEGEDTSMVQDAEAAKVHAISLLKILENDSIHGGVAAAALSTHGGTWDKYRHQKHDLFISRNDTRDRYLMDVDTGPTKLLSDTAFNSSDRMRAPPPMPGAASGGAGGSSATSDLFGSSTPSGASTPDRMKAPPPAPAASSSSPIVLGGPPSEPAPAAASGAPIVLGGPPAPEPVKPSAAAASAASATSPADPFAGLGGSPAPAAQRAPAAAAAAPAAPSSSASAPFTLPAAGATAPAAAPAAAAPRAAAAKPAAGEKKADPFADLFGSDLL